jgi:hypothetical protein
MSHIVQDVRTCLTRHIKGPGNVSDCTGCQNLSNMTHQGTRECVRLYRKSEPVYRFWHPVQSDTFLGLSCWTGSDILYNLTHSLVPWCVVLDRFWHPVQSDTFPGPLVCRVRQLLTSCTIWHIPWSLGVSCQTGSDILYYLTHSLVPWCVVLDRLWHPVQSDTFLGVSCWTGSDILYNLTHSLVPWCVVLDRFWLPVQSDTFGCQNLSNTTDQGMCQIVQEVRTCLTRHTKGPGNVSDCTGCQNLSNTTHQMTRECVRLYRMSEPV